MKNGLARFGQWAYNNSLSPPFSWIVILIVFVGSVVTLGSNFNDNLKISGVPSTNIQNVLKKEFNQSVDAGTMNIVVQNKDDDSIKSTADKKRINAAVSKIKSDYKYDIKKIKIHYDYQIVS